MAGRLGSQTPEQARSMYISNLKYAAQKLLESGIMGVIEPINKYDVPGYFLCDFYQALDILREVDEPNIKLLFDFYHQHHMEGGLVHKFKVAHDVIGHVQISQVPGRREPFSEGEINYDYVMKEITQSGYKGWVGLEYRPSVNTDDSLKWFCK